jgi:hypothetical protein
VTSKSGATALRLLVDKTLVELPANLEARTADSGASPLCLTAVGDSTEMVNTLVALGADIEATTHASGPATAIDVADVQAAIEARRKGFGTTLLLAAEFGYVQAVDTLVLQQSR